MVSWSQEKAGYDHVVAKTQVFYDRLALSTCDNDRKMSAQKGALHKQKFQLIVSCVGERQRSHY